jgi:apolipoprotein D and lipocalin family protein
MKTTLKLWGAAALVGTGLAIAGCATLLQRHPVGNRAVPEPAKPVELKRYLGRWFEIARYEQRFQKGCEGVTADYSLRSDGSIAVTNRCRKPDGKFAEAQGRAKIVDSSSNAKLKVSFFGPFYGDYWVLDHADDYSWSVVGEPSGRYLWILSREPTPAKGNVEALIERVRNMGYDVSMLLRTKQP